MTAATCSSVARLSTTGPPADRVPAGQQLADDADALGGGLSRTVDGFGQALAQGAVVVDHGVAEFGERQPAQPAHDLVGVDAPGGQLVEQRSKGGFVHNGSILPAHDRRRLPASHDRLPGTVRHLYRGGPPQRSRSGPGPAAAAAVVRARAVGRDRRDRRLRVRGPRELHRGHRLDRPRPAGLRAGPDHRRRGGPAGDPEPAGAPGDDAVRHPSHRVVPPRHRAVPGLADRQPARRGGGGGPLDRRGGPPGRPRGATATRPPSARRWPPSSTGWRCWPPRSRTTSDNSTRFVLVGPHDVRHPGADRARQDQRRVLSVERPPGQPARDPRAVFGPGPQPGEAGVPADQAASSASTASSSTSRATWPTRWWPTACGTCTPACAS